MMPAQFRIDLFDEIRDLVGSFDPVVLPGVVHELEGLSRAKSPDGAAARMGLTLAGQCITMESGDPLLPVDDQVVMWAGKNGGMIVTNDRRVREQALEQGIAVISLRKQKKLEIVRR